MQHFNSLFGIVAMIALAWLMSSHKSKFPWRTVVCGLGLQFLFAVVFLKTTQGKWLFDKVDGVFVGLLECVKAERDNLPPDERDGWIFPAKSKSGHVRQFNQSFRRVAVAANLNAKTVTPHLLRHTAITRLAERGVGDATIQKISGHKTASMVRRYTHIGEQAVDDAMRLLEHANRPDYTEITQNADRGVAA